MFTGIVEEIGTVCEVKRNGNNSYIRIIAEKVLSDVHIGDSIAVNGVCLTVTRHDGNIFQADVMNETLSRSSLGSLTNGSKVNLERAMSAEGRFGGHIVSGHIDGTGKITDIKNDGIAIWYTISAKPEIMRYIVEKGSVAIDGISLTVARVTENNFSVSIIPHTAEQTILSLKKIGDIVNLENDIIAKYVEKLIVPPKKKGVTLELLAQTGFI
ncbi:MAG TPA: riboflavin synthase [Ruminococcus sp.]|nr:riboflavin synthase [Ruminococcus sp.]